jgi:Heliorhodopsin
MVDSTSSQNKIVWLRKANVEPSGPLVVQEVFSYRIGSGCVCVPDVVGRFHFLVASPRAFLSIAVSLLAKRNRFRWVEYSLSSTLMIVLIAGTVGITDAAALLAIAGLNASMIFFGWLMETTNTPGPVANWFNGFAITQILQHSAKGKWADHLRGETTYVVLSLTAKSALAWQLLPT